MHQPKKLLTSIFVLGFILFCSAVLNAQQIESSYDLSLQLVIGSDENSQRGELPAELSNISKELKTGFKFSDYRLGATFLGRISNNGSFDYRSIWNIVGQESSPQSFVEWSTTNMKAMPNSTGKAGFQAQSFRFGARVPIVTSGVKDESNTTTQVYNYEQIGFTVSKIGLLENTPTLVGSLTLPGTRGTIFLILTIRAAD